VSAAPSAIRVIVADDHPVVRLGVRQLLAAEPDMEVVGDAADGDDAVRLTRDLRPDVLLLDLSMPRMPGLETLRELSDTADVRTIVLTAQVEERDVVAALQLGACGVVLKSAGLADLAASIRSVARGQYWVRGREVPTLVGALQEFGGGPSSASASTCGLTRRELGVIREVVNGGTNRDIATTLGITEDTVKRHLTNAFNKTGVSTRLELALFALHHLNMR
jgi:two-component system nitrate/nitrite response regulator NarL